jgi:hypothetical protein
MEVRPSQRIREIRFLEALPGLLEKNVGGPPGLPVAASVGIPSLVSPRPFSSVLVNEPSYVSWPAKPMRRSR